MACTAWTAKACLLGMDTAKVESEGAITAP